MPGYMMFFQWRKATWAIDATDSAHISRFINHSRRHANLVPVLLKDPDNPNQPVIFFKATRRIARGEELLGPVITRLVRDLIPMIENM